MIRPFLIGFATTFKHMFRKANTVNYPAEKVPVFPKYRGKQVLMRDENGLEKCVACGLCAVACPADAIYLEAAENDGTVQAGPRYASIYQIHKARCPPRLRVKSADSLFGVRTSRAPRSW
jgi:NADH-quinone oxidoreductase subunit I